MSGGSNKDSLNLSPRLICLATYGSTNSVAQVTGNEHAKQTHHHRRHDLDALLSRRGSVVTGRGRAGPLAQGLGPGTLCTCLPCGGGAPPSRSNAASRMTRMPQIAAQMWPNTPVMLPCCGWPIENSRDQFNTRKYGRRTWGWGSVTRQRPEI